MTPDGVQARIAAYEPLTFEPRGVQRAAVLVPLRRTADGAGLELILTRRSEALSAHGGQVAFPGGRIDDDDPTATDAALRETREELGIPPDRVDVIGRLDDMFTVTGYHVVAVVGIVDARVELRPDPSEVARAFSVPLSALLEAHRWQSRVHHWKGSELDVWHFPYDGEDVWGATGRTVRNMVELLWRAA